MLLPREYLHHILDEVDFILKESKSLSYEKFLKDPVLRRAFVRSLEIIGEASKKLPVDFRKTYPEVAWKALAGTRDKLIHDYFGIDYELLWDIVKNHIPELRLCLKKILKEEK